MVYPHTPAGHRGHSHFIHARDSERAGYTVIPRRVYTAHHDLAGVVYAIASSQLQGAERQLPDSGVFQLPSQPVVRLPVVCGNV